MDSMLKDLGLMARVLQARNVLSGELLKRIIRYCADSRLDPNWADHRDEGFHSIIDGLRDEHIDKTKDRSWVVSDLEIGINDDDAAEEVTERHRYVDLTSQGEGVEEKGIRVK
ncbi:MAG: hypothetical protein Q9225_003501 [Loekoesia sp. 1 TL-2023]